METSNVQNANTYNAQKVYSMKNEMVKTTDANKLTAPFGAKVAKDNPKNALLKQIHSSDPPELSVGTSIAFSVEKDLNLVVTRVMDTDTKKVLRQIPSEEVIKRMKLLETYHPLSVTKGMLVNDLVE